MNAHQPTPVEKFDSAVTAIETALATYERKIAKLESALNSCLEYLDGKVDVVDGDYGIPEPNREMSLVNEINEALGKGGY